MIGKSEILIIIFILVLLFGAKRIPAAAAALGEGLRQFKKALKGRPTRDIPPDKDPK